MSSKKKDWNLEKDGSKIREKKSETGEVDTQEDCKVSKVEEGGNAENTENAESLETDSTDSQESEGFEGDSGGAEACVESEEDEDLKTRYLRLAADFQNYKRRAEKERGDIYLYANEKLISDLLPVLDNFERAMEHSENSPDKSFAEGMELILKQFIEVLSKNKLEEIEAINAEFDPSMHDAAFMESVEGVESGIVTKVIQKGYMLNKKVIRPSMVAVSQ